MSTKKPTVSISQVRGQQAEALALTYLKKQGLTLRCRNFRTKSGEIDLIMEDGADWVFVEVRMRTQIHHGHPLETVTYAKQQKIIRAAQCYLQRFNACYTAPCRFDVVAISPQQTPAIEWVKDAFQSH